ncbi:Asp-tRNA(Asn)/Glu-tRNA(Gln) amidotransferase subunit GatB [Simkania negevensis]|uniref:Aspartyl/glutamyl-tRNA(Asn/Gln) amidotransferase subunit B n=1 Tax=Simkania negevensis TaxID=83561 RepID=A0ABS3APB7_9BACT|nr:Asp-tRNA(Asn)/Glu-tRNA(Gln) amidotransferase subunit GatB [Simkania negevensis]
MSAHSTLSSWEPVIGLELHIQLNTKTKLFSRAPNRFGDEPNTNITELCVGQPGSLPVINKEAIRKAIRFACAVGAEIPPVSLFDRKSYFYPDLPRNYQITQFYKPICKGGTVVADVDGKKKTFQIEHAHLEDDAGMLKHFSSFAGVDYNRAGTPLIEIVSTPCICSAQEAVVYGMALKAICEYLDISNCNMEEGNLRMDANISVRKKGEKGLRTKTEIKNMNSFTNMEMAIEAEIRRQIGEYTSHEEEDFEEVIQQATYRWDPERKETVLMRKKEYAADYRYFPEPDLPPLKISQAFIDEIVKIQPELPYEKKQRYIKQLGLSEYSASILVLDKKLADYFEESLAICSDAKGLCNWLTVEFAGRLKEEGIPIYNTQITSRNVAELVKMINEKTITGKIAKLVANDMVASPTKSCHDIVKDNPAYQPLHDEHEVEKFVDAALTQNEQSIKDYKKGKKKAFGFLVGQVMKLSQGKAPPELVNSLLKAKLNQ